MSIWLVTYFSKEKLGWGPARCSIHNMAIWLVNFVLLILFAQQICMLSSSMKLASVLSYEKYTCAQAESLS